MCLITKPFKTKKEAIEAKKNPKIAKRAITVYKLLGEDYTSIYKNFSYAQGVLYKSKLGISVYGERLIVNQGLHAYTTRGKAAYKRQDSWTGCGVHLVEMQIPKGALYIVGRDEEIVSNQLIWPKKKKNGTTKPGARKQK